MEKSQFIKEHDITSSPATSGRVLSQSPVNLLAIDDTHEHGEYLFYLVSYNPLEEGQFIIWGGQHNHGAFTGLVQLEDPFKPDIPANRTGMWNISHFFLTEVRTFSDSRGTLIHNTFERSLRLWISWKSYYSSIIQYVDLTSQLNWVTIMSDIPSDDPLDENTVDAWTERIITPGRFTDEVLITALNIYQDYALPPEHHRDLSSSSRVLRKDLISGIVGIKRKLGVNQHTNHLDFEKYKQDLAIEFSQFETTCKELAKAGDELRGITHDPRTGEVMIIRADGIMTIRNWSAAEIIMYATNGDTALQEVREGKMIMGSVYGDLKESGVRYQTTVIARMAVMYRNVILQAEGNLADITGGLLEEVMSDSHFSVQDQLVEFYEKYLPYEAPAELQDLVLDAMRVQMTAEGFRALLDILSTDICQDDTILSLEKLSSIWGDVISVGITEMIGARWTLLRDLALLSAWVYATLRDDISPLMVPQLENFWSEGLRAFKGVTLLRHLASTEISPSSNRQTTEDQMSGSLEVMKLDDSSDISQLTPRSTGLRYLVEETLDSSGVGLSRASFPPPAALSLAIASSLTNINFADGYTSMAIRLVSQLLRIGANVEAARFARYLPNTPVGGYVWGHVLLQKGSWDKAASWFSRLAPTLAKAARPDDYEYAKIILRGKQSDGVGKGLFRYYEHVARLFESRHAQSQVSDFCQRALGLAEVSMFPNYIDIKGSTEDRDALLMLMFSNAVDIANYDDAYMALTRLTNYETLPELIQLLTLVKEPPWRH